MIKTVSSERKVYSMQLRQLEYIIKIAESGSITQAAEQLFISQPSLTKSILQLEHEYGIQIFVRKPRGIELTDDGKEFIHYAKAVLTAANGLNERFLHPQTSAQASHLLIAAQQLDFIYQILLSVYEQNKEKNLHYSLTETDRNSVIQQVLNGQADLGILVRSSADSKTFLWHTEAKKLDIEVLAHAATYACVGPKSCFYERDSITTSEAEHCTSLVLDMGPHAIQNRYFSMTHTHFNLKRLIFFNTVSACEHFLLETDALLFVAKWTMHCFKNPAIHFFPVIPEKTMSIAPSTELLLIRRAGEPISPTEQQFIHHLKCYFGIE